MSQFLTDINRIRSQAKRRIDEGAVTPANKSNRVAVIDLLDAALSTEWICVLRYTQHATVASGLHAESVAQEFWEHAGEELEHAHRIAKRIHQLGGHPSLDPQHMSETAHSYYVECTSLLDMIKENAIAERIAIMSYTEMIRFVGDGDPTTRRLLEEILEKEEEHADEMADLLAALDINEKIDTPESDISAS